MKWVGLGLLAGIGLLLGGLYVDLRLQERKWDRRFAKWKPTVLLHPPQIRLK